MLEGQIVCCAIWPTVDVMQNGTTSMRASRGIMLQSGDTVPSLGH